MKGSWSGKRKIRRRRANWPGPLRYWPTATRRPAAGEPLPADRLRPDLDYYNVTALATDNIAPCSGACPCLVAVHARYASERVCRMDPDTPNIILGCTDHHGARRCKRQPPMVWLATPPPSPRSKRRPLHSVRPCERALRRSGRRRRPAGPPSLPRPMPSGRRRSPVRPQPPVEQYRFLRYAFKRGNAWWIENAVKEAADTGVRLCSRMLEQLKESTRAYQDDVGVTVYDLESCARW